MKKKPEEKPAAGSHLGIDLAKDKFDAVLRRAGGSLQHKVFTNDAAGLKTFGRWLSEHRAGRTITVMEATGIYWEEVAAWLHARRHTVHVLNPAQARRFAQSQLSRNKTDAVDAALLCRMAQISIGCELTVWAPPAAEVLTLRRLARGRQALVDHQAALLQQAKECQDSTVRKALEAGARALHTQMDVLERRVKEHLAAHPVLAEDIALLDSIQAVGFWTAVIVRAELAPLPPGQYGVPQAVAYAGLNPQQWQSGSSIRAQSRLSKTGNARLRRALYLPALCGKRFNPILRAFAARLLAKGKPKMQVIGALMHKLLALACGVLKTRQPFDPAWLAPEQSGA